jgi:hypothetical protein
VKVARWRSHKANPGNYESIDTGTRIEIDTEIDTDYAGMSDDEIAEDLEARLDILLDKPVDRVLRLGGTINESHLWDYYEKG